jgi:hypothetical protein
MRPATGFPSAPLSIQRPVPETLAVARLRRKGSLINPIFFKGISRKPRPHAGEPTLIRIQMHAASMRQSLRIRNQALRKIPRARAGARGLFPPRLGWGQEVNPNDLRDARLQTGPNDRRGFPLTSPT